MMAPCGLKFAVTLILIFSLSFLPSKSVESCKICGRHSFEWLTRKTMYITCDVRCAGLQWPSLKQRKMLIGSRPPGCVNKCMSCRPCMATLVVIHPHDDNKKGEFAKISDSVSRREDDDPYYLLSWKCKCGDKLYQP